MATGKIIQLNFNDVHKVSTYIELPLDTYLTQNFKLSEMVDRTTNELILCPDLLSITQQARTLSGHAIQTSGGLSWYRSEKFNDDIGGVPWSLHTRGLAHDSKWFKGGEQLHPLHCAYLMHDLAVARNLNYEIGIYFPGYDGSSTKGYLHFGIHSSNNSIYYYDSKGVYRKVDSLKDVNI